MKKIRVEVNSTLTYTPFENISKLLNEAKKEERENDRNRNSHSNGK